MILIELLCIQLVAVFIVDLSGIVDSLKRAVWRFAKGAAVPFQPFRLKPLDCSLCVTFWACLLYLLFAGRFSLPLFAYVCALAYLTPAAGSLLRIVKDAAGALLNWIETQIEKI